MRILAAGRRTATDQVGVQLAVVNNVLDLCIYVRIAGWLWSAAKAHPNGLEQGDRARIMRLAYIRDVGIGTSIRLYCAYFC